MNNTMQKLRYKCDVSESWTVYPMKTEMLPQRILDEYGLEPGEVFAEWGDLLNELLDHNEIPYDAVEWGYPDYDDEQKQMVLNELLRDAPYYLIVARHVRWDGADGYKVCNSREQCFYRDYDCTIIPESVSPDKRLLVCSESSHDNPTGSETDMLSLTCTEANKIQGWLNSDNFARVDKFVRERHERYAEPTEDAN